MTDSNITEKTLSPALTRRLPAYFRTLLRFYGTGKERISSEELAAEMGLAPSQVRADMKAIGCVGQRSYGYGIPTLYKTIGGILQLSDRFGAVIVGSSPLAKAISSDNLFARRGIRLAATVADGETGAFISALETKKPEIVIFCGDPEFAGEATEKIGSLEVGKCVLQVWNFTDSEFCSDKVTVKNVHLSDILIGLCSQI